MRVVSVLLVGVVVSTVASLSNTKVVVLSRSRLDWDKKVDWSSLEASFADALTREDIQNCVTEECQVLVTKELRMDKETIEALPKSVKMICEAGTGYDNIDGAAARARNIDVCNVAGYSTEAVAQLVMTFILSFASSFMEQQRMLEKGDKSNFFEHLKVPTFELHGKNLGLIGGNGSIGKRVAEIAKCLGMTVLTYSRTSGDLDDLLAKSDFISLHCPLTPATKGLIDKKTIAKMKPTAFIINTARGPIINEADLIEALETFRIAGAALDVQSPEPPKPDSQLYTLPNVLLTPHIGWRPIETRQRLIDLVATNVNGFLAGGKPTNVVN